MSKLGRYSAQRRKFQELTGAKTVQVSECGTHFALSASSVATYRVTLPSLATAGPGWWCKFTLTDATAAQDIHIQTNLEDQGVFFGQVHAVSGAVGGGTALGGHGRMLTAVGTASFVVASCPGGESIVCEAMAPASGPFWQLVGFVSSSAGLSGSV